jgi:hypothetical protein
MVETCHLLQGRTRNIPAAYRLWRQASYWSGRRATPSLVVSLESSVQDDRCTWKSFVDVCTAHRTAKQGCKPFCLCDRACRPSACHCDVQSHANLYTELELLRLKEDLIKVVLGLSLDDFQKNWIVGLRIQRMQYLHEGLHVFQC